MNAPGWSVERRTSDKQEGWGTSGYDDRTADSWHNGCID